MPWSWSRRPDSNYGKRIDCFAWGDSVYTADSTSEAYAADFSGTSSAAAIIAGAALSVQGMAQGNSVDGLRIPPGTLRKILSGPATGTSAVATTADPNGDKIGVMPDLMAIAHKEWGLPLPT